jgi:hypothetical protein
LPVFSGLARPVDRSTGRNHSAYFGLAFLILPTLSAIDACNRSPEEQNVNARVWCKLNFFSQKKARAALRKNQAITAGLKATSSLSTAFSTRTSAKSRHQRIA